MRESLGVYVGPDRRQRLPRAVHEPNRRLLLAMAAAVVLYGVAIPTVVAELLGSGRSIQAATVATIACTILFAQGGLLLLLRWRLTGEGRFFQLGIAGLVYGFFVAPLAEVFGILATDPADQAVLQAVAQSVVGVLAAVFAAKSALTRPVDSRLHFGRSLGAAAGSTVALAGVSYAACRAMPLGAHQPFSVAAAAAAAAAWTAAAGTVLWRGRAGELPMSRLLSAPLVVLALGEIASAVSVGTAVPFSLDASALTMMAGVLFALSGAYVLLTALSVQGASSFRLRGLLQNLEQYRAREEERTHDARAALLAVQTAITALTRYRERLDDQSRTNLELAVDAELDRLLALMAGPVQPTRPVDRRPFDVVRAVTAVTAAATTFGLRIHVDAPGAMWAVGNRDDTARALETLLDNARRYARGSPITVRVRGDVETVRIAVADLGPGIADDERDLVFRRGGRGRSSRGLPGTGLGLFAARRLMEDQDGTLVLAEPGLPGATFVLTLPAAQRAEVPVPVRVADGRSRHGRPAHVRARRVATRPATADAPSAADGPATGSSSRGGPAEVA